MKRTVILFVFAMALALIAGMFTAGVVNAEPSPGTQVHLPILTWLGDEADACDVVIEVQNVGDDFTKAMIFFWGAPGACPPQCNGPFKVECSGLLKPGSTWNFIGPGAPAQVPSGAKKGIVFSLSNDQSGGDIFADAICEAAFANVRADCDEYRRFKKAFDEESTWRGFDFGDAKGEPLAVEVVRKCQTATMDAPVVGAYSGISGEMLGPFDFGNTDVGDFGDPVFGGFAFYTPVLYADQDGLNSWIYIQNAGLECTSVEIWVKQLGECIRSTISEIPALAPGETIQVDVSELGVGPFWTGNAWIRTSVPTAIVVDNWSNDVLLTYHGKPAELNFTFDPNAAFFTQGSQVNYAPLVYREHQGWNTNIYVQNLSSVVNAKVKVYFLDNSGDIIKTVVDWICPRGTQVFPLAVIDGLRGNWVGQARVESQEWWTPGDPAVLPPNVVSVAELIRWDGPAQTVLLEGVAYNLFPEKQAFDWQVGRGKGGLESGVGLIGIPSFLNNMSGGGETGLTTELAIANLVPKPGFTDFAIYIYDQNGLLDFVCEKLNEKQVEYINVADDWNYINDGFKGSAVISAVFWEHDVLEGPYFVRNLVGLAAVKIERFNWPQVPSTDPADDAPGDQASASEGFPIAGPFNTSAKFDFEGPNAPRCPGVGEGCTAVVAGTVYDHDGNPVQLDLGVLIQIFPAGGDVPIWSGTLDSDGHFTATIRGLPEVGVRVFDVRVFWPDEDLDVTFTNALTLACTDQVVLNLTMPGKHKIEGFATESCWQVAPWIAKLSGATVELWKEDSCGTPLPPDQDICFKKKKSTTTDSQGYFKFKDVVEDDDFYLLKICFDDGNGNTVCFETEPFLVDSQDEKFWFRYNSEVPDWSFWCDGFKDVTVTCDGVPVEGARVVFDTDADGVVDGATDAIVLTGADGVASLDFGDAPRPFASGTWQTWVDESPANGVLDPGEDFDIEWVAGPQTENFAALEFCPPEPPPEPGSIFVFGTVEDKLTGLPIEGATVSAENCVDFAETTTDENGEYSLELTFDPDCTTWVVAGAVGYNPSADSVFIPEGDTAQITFQLRQTPKSRVLLYYGNGGVGPDTEAGALTDYFTLQALFEDMGFIVDYTDQWPTQFDWTTKYKLIVLLGPGHASYDPAAGTEDLTVDGFTIGQKAELDSFLQQGGVLVVLSDNSAFTGQDVENDLLAALPVDGLQFNKNAWADGLGNQVTDDCQTENVAVIDTDAWTDVVANAGADPGVLVSQNASADPATNCPNCPMYAADVPSHGNGEVKIIGDLNFVDDFRLLSDFNWPADNEWVVRNWLLCDP